MKGVLAGLLTLGLLAACSAPVTVRLPDQTFPISASTLGKVIYPKDPLSFERPPVRATKVVVRGEAELSSYFPLSLDVYARVSEPSECSEFFDVYVCGADHEGTLVGRIDPKEASSTSFTLGEQGGEALAQGINQGRLWLGVKVGGTRSLDTTLTLKNMTATVTVRLF